ncbi:MAG: DUF1016 domain-containing protein [Planctomycetes bacterium]|nr:DUF1016 domain-containing protein [Planctomycetota bacterium]
MKKRARKTIPAQRSGVIQSPPAGRTAAKLRGKPATGAAKRTTTRPSVPTDYVHVLADMKRLIADARHRALTSVNRELVCLYWQIGHVIVQQQDKADWGDAVVEQLATDLRAAFPDMKGLSRDNLWRMRQFFLSVRDVDGWWQENLSTSTDADRSVQKLGTVSRDSKASTADSILGTVSRELTSGALIHLLPSMSWSHHTEIMSASDQPDERYFYMAMSARERWSVRELRRQNDWGLFLRYMSVKRDPEKCLPAEVESGDLLPFKDHYVLEFLGLSEDHSERDLRKAILANLRDFFLEFGRDMTFAGEEYPMTVGKDTFRIDLLFFHRRLQCLIAVDLKIGGFLPEYVGKSLFYVAALDEQIRLPHERPSIGLILCRDADHVQVRLALTPAAKKIGVATYETALPDLRLIRQRLAQFTLPKESNR